MMFWQGLSYTIRISIHQDTDTILTIQLNLAVVIELH